MDRCYEDVSLVYGDEDRQKVTIVLKKSPSRIHDLALQLFGQDNLLDSIRFIRRNLRFLANSTEGKTIERGGCIYVRDSGKDQAGTIACILKEGEDWYVLTCAHTLLKGMDKQKYNDFTKLEAKKGHEECQVFTSIEGIGELVIGSSFKYILGLFPIDGQQVFIDAAVVKLEKDTIKNHVDHHIYHSQSPYNPYLGFCLNMEVEKLGCKTSQTFGKVKHSGCLNTFFPGSEGNSLVSCNMILISGLEGKIFGEEGDSGR